MNIQRISARQFMMLVILYSIGSSILLIPSSQAHFAKQDGWIATIAGCVIGLLLIRLYMAVGNLSPRQNLFQLTETIFGRWIGKFVALLLLATLFLGGPAAVLFNLGEFMTTQIMPATPLPSISILFAIILVVGVRLGLEVLARTAEVLVPWFFLLFLILVLFITPELEPDHLKPVLEDGFKPLGPAILTFLSIASLPLVVLLLIFPASVNQQEDARAAFWKGYLVGGAVMFGIVLICIMVLGPDLAARSIYPSYTVARKINVGNFLQRIEAVMAFMWLITLYFRMALYLYAMAVGLAQIFNLKDYRPLVLPLGLLLVTFSLSVYPNTVYGQNSDIHTWVPYALTIGLLYPLALLAVAGLRRFIRPNQAQGGEPVDKH